MEKNTGGRWKFELRLEATQPDVDGSITIQAGPGQSAVGELALFSPTEQPEHFTCHFSYDSPISFDVSPAEVRAAATLHMSRHSCVSFWHACPVFLPERLLERQLLTSCDCCDDAL